MAGYSGTPLLKKLGLADVNRAIILYSPPHYAGLLCDWNGSLSSRLYPSSKWIQGFYTDKETLETEFSNMKDHLNHTGQLWISWPKKSSQVQSNINENIVREIGLAAGLVDVKVVAIDKTWSGLKFVYRRKDRH